MNKYFDTLKQHTMYSRLQIAEKFGLDTKYLTTYWESKKMKSNINEVLSICIFFGISVDDYLESQKAKLVSGVDNLSNTVPTRFDPCTFGNNVRDLRIAKGLSTGDLAAIVGLDERAIQYYEAGQRTPSVDNLINIAVALKVPVSYLLY